MPAAIDVLLPLPIGPLTYLPPLQGDTPGPGRRVVVPWQAGVRIGVVCDVRTVDAGRGVELRHALHALEGQVWLDHAALATVTSLARHSGVPAGLVLATLNPPGLQQELDHEVRLAPGGKDLLAALDHPPPREAEGGAWFAAALVPGKALEELRRQGLIDERARPRALTRRVLVPVRPPDDELEGARRLAQRTALERLFELDEAESAAALAADADVSPSAVRSLVAKGYAAYAERPQEEPAPPLPHPAPEALPAIKVEQVPPEGDGAVVGARRRARLAALLPRLRADLAAGRSVLVLAPEAAMADAAASDLATALPVSLLSGEATDRQRVRLWRELERGRPQVLVGTYLALLAPLENLGRVVVLDFASSAYKLQAGSRTLVSKAATLRARLAAVPLTLLDVVAGPDLVVQVAAAARRHLPLPRLRLHVADLAGGGNWPVHPDLTRTLKQVVERERQALILAPRRGYSGALGCPECGWQAPCPNCDLTLRYHRAEGVLRCHQCGHAERPPDTCPACGGTNVGPLRGAGTEWVAAQVRRSLDGFPVYRYDRDHRDDVTALLAGAPGVVVGTLALLSLPPLPELSLIGITHFDAHLMAADFRAEEEVLRTVLRLAELTGGRQPLVLVQTFSPEHELLRALGAPDPAAALELLLAGQLARRKRFGYPPYAGLAKLQFSARDRGSALAAAQHALDALLTGGALQGEVLGPASAPVERVRGQYHFQLLLRGTDEVRLEALLALVPGRYPGARLGVDVDPRDVGALLD